MNWTGIIADFLRWFSGNSRTHSRMDFAQCVDTWESIAAELQAETRDLRAEVKELREVTKKQHEEHQECLHNRAADLAKTSELQQVIETLQSQLTALRGEITRIRSYVDHSGSSG